MRIMPLQMSAKVPFNLSVDAELKRQMKVHCAGTDKDVSEVTEQLYADFLRSRGVRVEELPDGGYRITKKAAPKSSAA